jgi:hypothetical protein
MAPCIMRSSLQSNAAQEQPMHVSTQPSKMRAFQAKPLKVIEFFNNGGCCAGRSVKDADGVDRVR